MKDDFTTTGVHFERSKKVYFLGMAIVAIFAAFIFAFIFFQKGDNKYWIALLAYGLVSIGLLFYLKQNPGSLQKVINIHAGLLFTAQCASSIYMLDYPQLYSWFVVFPMIYFFLLGHRWGLVLAVSLGFFYVAGYLIHPLFHHPPQVSKEMLIHSAFAYLVITGLTSVYARFITIRHEETSHRADIDYLTGIYNRSAFQVHLDREISRMVRQEGEYAMCVILFDIDNFKAVNDEYGHNAGDEVLKEICRLVAANLRKHDTFARWGGEEFIIIVPGTNLSGACRVAEKLRVEIAKHRFHKVRELTSSFGVSEYKKGEAVREFIHRVDGALYQAKGNGKNRVESA